MTKRLLLSIALVSILVQVSFSQSFLSVEYLGSRTPSQLSAQFFFLTSFTYPVDFYRVTYESTNIDQSPAVVSGLLVLPDAPLKKFPVACYMHGTSGTDQDVPSQLGLDADLPIALAAKGYVTIAPDYLGLGVHDGIHPYVHAESEAWVGIDMLRALKNYLIEQGIEVNDQLFLTGYSQGGHAAMAMHREIETGTGNEFTVTAAAHMSGPYSIGGVMRDLMLSDEPYTQPGYLINTLISYQFVYGNLYNDLSEVFKAPYLPLVGDFSNGVISLSDLNDGLISLLETIEGDVVPSKMITDDYLQGVAMDPSHPANLSMNDNNVYDWTPVSPTRLYYCDADEQVPFENSILAETVMQGNGAMDVDAISINASLDHFFCAFPASITTADFFELYQQVEDIPLSSFEQIAGDIGMYPNPTSGSLTIPGLDEPARLSVYDLAGRMLWSDLVQSDHQTVELEGLQSGVYVAELIRDNQIYIEKLVIQR